MSALSEMLKRDTTPLTRCVVIAEVNGWHEVAEAAAAELAEKDALTARYKNLLRPFDMRYAGVDACGQRYCIFCDCLAITGQHANDCKLAAALEGK